MRRSSCLTTQTSQLRSRVRQTPCCPCAVGHNQLFFCAGAIACKFRGSGQTCVCANRIYVQSSVYAIFASKLAEKVAAFRIGDGFDDDTYVFFPAG